MNVTEEIVYEFARERVLYVLVSCAIERPKGRFAEKERERDRKSWGNLVHFEKRGRGREKEVTSDLFK